jgi:hypothetical protein
MTNYNDESLGSLMEEVHRQLGAICRPPPPRKLSRWERFKSVFQ